MSLKYLMNIHPNTLMQKVNSNKAVAIAVFFLPILILRVLFIITYPLNNAAGDEGNYYAMLLSWKSSLVHAGGYPFLFGLLFRSDTGQAFAVQHPVQASYIVLILQHGIELAMLFLVFFVLSKIYSNLIAGISILIFGLDVWSMGWTSTTYPEWLQAALLISAFCVAFYALESGSYWKKTALYVASLMLFALSFVTKFNALGMILFFGVIFLIDRTPFWKRILTFGIAGLSAGIVVLTYVVFYHFPSTGTSALTYDKSWILVQKTSMYNAELPPQAGINTKRWIALSEVLPPNYSVAGPNMYAHIDAVPAAVRKPYREKFLYLLTADEGEVDKVLEQHQLPEGFYLPYSAVPISYYMGLKESDDLGVKVYKEVLLYFPSKFFIHVVEVLKETLLIRRASPVFPINTALLNQVAGQYGAEGYCLKQVRSLGNGFIKYKLIQPICQLTSNFWSNYPVIWMPGMNFFSKIWNVIPFQIIYLVIGVSVLITVGSWIMNRKNINRQSILIVLVAGIIAIYFVQSSVSFVVRPKEIRFVSPLFDILFGICISQLILQITFLYKHLTRKQSDRKAIYHATNRKLL